MPVDKGLPVIAWQIDESEKLMKSQETSAEALANSRRMSVNLPASNAMRWSAHQKAAVVDAVSNGLLALEDACERYALTIEEFRSWQETFNSHGVAGLRAKTAQERRNEARRTICEPAVVMADTEGGARCLITDISARGARLALKIDAQLPSIFELLCTRTGRGVRVCLVWQRDRQVGVSFQLAAPWAIDAGVDRWLLGERA